MQTQTAKYHLEMIAALSRFLDRGDGNADAIARRVGFHRAQLAKSGGFVL